MFIHNLSEIQQSEWPTVPPSSPLAYWKTGIGRGLGGGGDRHAPERTSGSTQGSTYATQQYVRHLVAGG